MVVHLHNGRYPRTGKGGARSRAVKGTARLPSQIDGRMEEFNNRKSFYAGRRKDKARLSFFWGSLRVC